MCFIKFPLTWKDYKTKGHREQSHKSFPVQTSLFLSYLLPNSMSQGLFGEALNHRNNKKEENLTGKLRVLGMLSFTLFFANIEWRQTLDMVGNVPPSQFILPEAKFSRNCVVAKSNNTCASNARGEERGFLILTSPQVQKVHTDKTCSWQLARISKFFSFQISPKYCCRCMKKEQIKKEKKNKENWNVKISTSAVI